VWRLGCARTRSESLQRFPRPLDSGEREVEGQGREREGREGEKSDKGREGKSKGWAEDDIPSIQIF